MRYLALCALLAACPPPEEELCARVALDEDGVPVSGRMGTPARVLGVISQPVVLTVFSPQNSCVSDTLRASVRAFDASNREVTAELVSAPARAGTFGAVEVRVSLTPQTAGPHLVQVAFEPSLGQRSIVLVVADDGPSKPSVPLALPVGCRQPWAVGDALLACEDRDAGLVRFSGPGSVPADFPGHQLVVADDALWSVDPDGGVLERRLWRDGGVTRTHAFGGFLPDDFPGLHDRDTALRVRTDGQLGGVRITDSGAVPYVFRYDSAIPPVAWFISPGGQLHRWSSTPCGTTCITEVELLALEPRLRWRRFGTGSIGAFPHIDGNLDEPAPLAALTHPARSVVLPGAGFERVPLWLAVPGRDDLGILVRLVDGQLDLSAWPRGPVRRVGSRHLVLETDGGVVVHRL